MFSSFVGKACIGRSSLHETAKKILESKKKRGKNCLYVYRKFSSVQLRQKGEDKPLSVSGELESDPSVQIKIFTILPNDFDV